MSTKGAPSLRSVLAASLAVSGRLASASSPPASSPEASSDSDLICHVPASPGGEPDCYPRVFRPTDEFQVLRDDQELPKRPPLHVRLNVATGRREARINVPGEGVDPALEGLPVERAVVAVERAVQDEDEDQEGEEKGGRGRQDQHLYHRKGAPAYDPVGKVKEPPAALRQHEAVTFAETFRMLKAGGGAYAYGDEGDDSALDRGLEGMEELSHDIFYGLQIAEDPEVVKALFCLMGGGDPRVGNRNGNAKVDGKVEGKVNDDGNGNGEGQGQGQGAAAVPRDQQAAAILAGALSNNPKALGEVAKVWADMMSGPECPGSERSLRDSFYSSLTSPRRPPAMVKARVAATYHLLKDASIRGDFLHHGGMGQLLEVLLVHPDPEVEVELEGGVDKSKGKGKEGAEWSAARRKVGQLVLDTFLDEDMGAQPGQWPRAPRLDDATCRRPESAGEEGCWDFHVAKTAAAHRGVGEHWSRELEGRLALARSTGSGSRRSSARGGPGGSGHDEL
ncbi:Nucleotide exchange factor SIL1 [Escovopsis weberi]|uniref:Nucleotide exchange factor SIL1 n=1 Tax=Escovopsis weberi TaxID=150374 RepID=A0A0M8MX90_ESCWE|nr:Nucleotide exchange factor SIL1 [Escovopsis weberi]